MIKEPSAYFFDEENLTEIFKNLYVYAYMQGATDKSKENLLPTEMLDLYAKGRAQLLILDIQKHALSGKAEPAEENKPRLEERIVSMSQARRITTQQQGIIKKLKEEKSDTIDK